jgi:hypothetical protein
MRFSWPADTVFTRQVLCVEQDHCERCQGPLHVCDHRFHRVFSLTGPLELVCKLAHCPDPGCPAHHHTLSPLAETWITLPWWTIAWDVFCWLGFRRFARHWSVPQLQAELRDGYQIRLSDDALCGYLKRYRCMVAARHQDPDQLAGAYRDIDRLVLTIDGVQPEKGHETLYVVRELRGKRVWFAEPLLSSSTAEVQRLLTKARDWADRLGKPVELWMSDKQDAFVQGIAAEFSGVPHRYCANHFLRDVAKPVLEADSHAKVQMRRKVRGLRDIEQQVLEQRQQDRAEQPAGSPSGRPAAASEPATSPTTARGGLRAESGTAGTPADGTGGPRPEPNPDPAGAVVLDYCAAVRGILNDDQGGPLHPPGLRMAEALGEVRESLQRNLDAKKGGARRSSCAGSRGASTGGCRRSRPTNSRSGSRSGR